MRRAFFTIAVFFAAAGAAAQPQTAPKTPAFSGSGSIYPELRAFYEDLHRNPELGYQEVRTAAKLAMASRRLNSSI